MLTHPSKPNTDIICSEKPPTLISLGRRNHSLSMPLHTIHIRLSHCTQHLLQRDQSPVVFEDLGHLGLECVNNLMFISLSDINDILIDPISPMW